MVSNINPTNPVTGIDQPVQVIRDNFSIAKIEIEELQNRKFDRSGDVMSGILQLSPIVLAGLPSPGFTPGGLAFVTDGDPIAPYFSDGSAWRQLLVDTDAINELNDIGDINIGEPGVGQDGFSLTWDNAAGEFILTPAGAGTVSSVNISSPGGTVDVGGGPITASGTLTIDIPNSGVTPGSFTNANITIDAQGRIIAAANGITTATTLDDLSDIDITAPSTGEYLRFDGVEWVNSPLNIVDDITPQLGGQLDAQSNKIVNLLDPTTDQDAATKKYVDDELFAISALVNIVDDSTPQLGGNLDVNGNSIISVSGGDIVITPDGSGSIVLDGLSWPQTDGTNGQVLTSDGSGNLSFTTIVGGALDNVVDDTTPQLGGNLDVNGSSIVSIAAGDIAITPDSSGSIVLDGLSWPQTDGTNGQVLTSDGSGNLSFTSIVSSGLDNIVEDLTPQLGGDLDANFFDITISGEVVLSFASGGETGVNNVEVVNGITGFSPIIRSVGSDTDVDMTIEPKGDGIVVIGITGDSEIRGDINSNLTIGGGDSDSSDTGGDTIIISGDGSGGFDSGDIFLIPGIGGTGDGDLILAGLTWPIVDGTVGQALTTDGSGTLGFSSVGSIDDVVDDTTPQLGGNLDAQNNKIVSLATPTVDADAANKAYVDSLAAGLDPKESVRVATTADLSFTFVNNGGVGDTLTAGGIGTTDIDTITLADTDRVLVKNQTDAKENGIYVASDTAGGSITVLIRAVDQDGSPSNEVSAGNFTFVETGSSSGSTSWVVIGDGELAVNTDDIDWVKFSDVSGSLVNLVDDISPQLGGHLDVNGFNITMPGSETVDGRDLSVDGSKLDGIAIGANLYAHPNHTGDVTSTGDGATVIAADAVTYAKMQNVVADERLLGNVSGAGAVVAELDQATVITFLGIEAGATADQTAADIRVLGFFDITNDGTGSGLDADLLDGSEGSAFAKKADNNTFTKAQRGAPVAIASSATITPDFDAGNNFDVDTIDENFTLANPTNMTNAAGQSGAIIIVQDGTGSRLLSSAGGFWKFPGGTLPVLSTAIGAVDTITYYVRSSTFIVANVILDSQ